VKNVHGEEAFRQKKHKRTDDNNEKRFEELKENISNTIPSVVQLNHSKDLNNQSNIRIENNNYDDDDEDVIVDQGISLNVDVN
jgi:hypothetical protein